MNPKSLDSSLDPTAHIHVWVQYRYSHPFSYSCPSKMMTSLYYLGAKGNCQYIATVRQKKVKKRSQLALTKLYPSSRWDGMQLLVVGLSRSGLPTQKDQKKVLSSLPWFDGIYPQHLGMTEELMYIKLPIDLWLIRPCKELFDGGKSITRAMKVSAILGPKQLSLCSSCFRAQKSLDFPLKAFVMDFAPSKTLHAGPNNS